ncbi:hypothetical protein K3G63_14475 [Hymenobacter sp. HSC-4F20]|uniref:chryseobasin-related MNIO class RiPP peptide n=1 Tax=Hymenobacter sp. HSC-4F20 TaxID=2864135 RepID=UPI001C72B85C|nr:hypothetical protein [Hymenobacter sp. HSC-4F20]MBX0291653.1 hypothetical protein [Hymenobacter sp. HSC-4F20]
MKLSKALLSAVVVGLTVQATGCTTNDPTPKGEDGKKTESESSKTPANCPGCGMG